MSIPDLNGKIVTVFGGTGFVGRYIVAQLAAAGALVKIVTRHTPSAYFLRTYGNPGQIVPVCSRYESDSDLARIVAGSFAVVNCLGILNERGKRSSFARLHTDIPAAIAKACATTHVSRLVHISALGVDRATSSYAITKILGESKVQQNFPDATILRPSVVFGAEDNFLNMFARLSRILPAFPLIGGGKTRFQPVYVVDIARAVVRALCDVHTTGQIYQLGGPEILTFRQIYERLFAYTGIRRALVPVPWWVARIQAFFMGLLPNPLLTNDQVTSLQTDNIVADGALGLADLGLVPTPMDAVVPAYLGYMHDTSRKDEK